MWYVYVIESLSNPDFIYIGYTKDLKRRQHEHNDGKSQATKPYIPFQLAVYIAVRTETKAKALEQYFKTGSVRSVQKDVSCEKLRLE